MSQDSEEVIYKRKRRSRLRTFRNLILFLLIAALCWYLYTQRALWLPKLEGIGSRYENQVTQNDGTLAEGNFPLTISGNTGYQLKMADNTLFLLHDNYLDLYSIHGDLQDSRQHAFQNAMLSTAGKYGLVYENNGKSFRLDTKNKNLYNKTADNNIISGVVSEDGSVALITESGSYACCIEVYDDTGKRIYQRSCVNHVTDVVFHNDNKGCCFTTINVENGAVSSTVTSVSFHQKEEQWTSSPIDTLEIYTRCASDGTICVVGNTACAYYSKNGELLGNYAFEGTLIDAHLEDGRAAMIIQDDQQRATSLVLLDQSAEKPSVTELPSTASCVRVFDGDAYVMSPGNVTSYDFSGEPLATVTLEGAYTSFIRENGYLFLLGYDQVDRVDFKE